MNCDYCGKPILIPSTADHKRFCSPSDHKRRHESIPLKSCRQLFHVNRYRRALAALDLEEQRYNDQKTV